MSSRPKEGVDRSTALSERIGEVLLGKYRIERELGRGGMGYVVAARHLELGELVAIKLILGEYAQNEEMVRRFMREARAAAQIASEHVVRVMDVGRLPSDEPYMVMELLKGEDLEHVLAARGQLPIAEAVDLLMQVLEAVAEAHAAGIVHRDLKPANLYVTRRRTGAPCVKVLDFGISKLTGDDATGALAMTQGVLGSPLYMSPEQLRSSVEVDSRADLWSLGVILFQMLTTDFPFVADSMPQLIAKVLGGEPASLRALRPDAPEALEAIVLRCLAPDRADRYASVAELAQALAPFGTPAAQSSLAAVENALPASHDAGGSPPAMVRPPSSPDLAPAARATVALPKSHVSTFEALDSSSPESLPTDRRSRTRSRVLAAVGLISAFTITIAVVMARARPAGSQTSVVAGAVGGSTEGSTERPRLATEEPSASSSRSSPPFPSTASVSSPTPSAIATGAAAGRLVEAAPVPSAPPAPSAPSRVAPRGSTRSTSAPPTPPPSSSPPPPEPAAPPAARCSPPYNISATGAHVPKPECL